MHIAVDANIILSALLGGKPSIILYSSQFQFITTEFTLAEVEKYLPRLSKKLQLSINELRFALSLLPLEQFHKKTYQQYLAIAKTMIGQIDEKDVDILALALRFDCYLWSQDKDFEHAGYPRLLKTYDLLFG